VTLHKIQFELVCTSFQDLLGILFIIKLLKAPKSTCTTFNAVLFLYQHTYRRFLNRDFQNIYCSRAVYQFFFD